jgi:hypothetical protein
MLAAYYVGRLRRLYPKANGESGCSHRLFTIALLVAYRYHQRPAQVAENFYCWWSAAGGATFAATELQRMELEMVAFLKFKLYIRFDDFEYFVDQVFNQTIIAMDGLGSAGASQRGGGQIVPHNLDIEEIIRPRGPKSLSGEHEAACQTVPSFGDDNSCIEFFSPYG